MRTIVIVDDNEDLLTMLRRLLSCEGVVIHTATTAEAALVLMKENPPDLLLIDICLPGMSGIELLHMVRDRLPDSTSIVITANGDLDTTAAAVHAGAVKVMAKPFEPAELRAAVDFVLSTRRKQRPRVPASQSAAALVGKDPCMVDLFERIARAASTDISVLIRGETGTGKEIVARELHRLSARSSQPFIAVNCTAFSSNLLESELFGHVRGAFTGADKARAGRLETAGAGTLFLDEIGDSTPEFQAKLLRVMQEREYYPVGSDTPKRVTARLITATHRDLESMISTHQFRADLFFRISVMEIALPPLRQRTGDIPALAASFLQKAASAEHLKDVPVLSPAAVLALVTYSWPGNVRELENCMARMVALVRGRVINEHDLGLPSRAKSSPGAIRALSGVEREHVARVFRYANGNKSKTASILKISRTRLDRLLMKHGIETGSLPPGVIAAAERGPHAASH